MIEVAAPLSSSLQEATAASDRRLGSPFTNISTFDTVKALDLAGLSAGPRHSTHLDIRHSRGR